MVDCPQKINWKITFRCNADMRCKFCYSPSIKTIQNKWIQICDTIIEHPPKLVVLAGGEPTTHPNFVDIVKTLHSNKIKICLATNGIDLVNIFPDFYKYINIISLPIEGEYYIHSKLRDKYSFINSIQILDLLKKIKSMYDIRIFINTVCLQDNINELKEISNIIRNYPIDVWKIFDYIYYKNVNSKNNPVQVSSYLLCNLQNMLPQTLVRYETCSSRSNRYFMINPDGNVVVPRASKDNEFIDIGIGSFIDDYEGTINRWNTIMNNNNYIDANSIFHF